MTDLLRAAAAVLVLPVLTAAQPPPEAIDPDFAFRRRIQQFQDRNPDWLGPIVAGTVRRAVTGRPVCGALVEHDRATELARTGRSITGIEIPRGLSDEHGRYVAAVLPVAGGDAGACGLPVRVRAAGYVETVRWVPQPSEPRGPVLALDLCLEPSLAIDVVVRDPLGRALPRAAVRILRDGLPLHVVVPFTDPDGRVLWDLGVPLEARGLALVAEGTLDGRPVHGRLPLGELRPDAHGCLRGEVRCGFAGTFVPVRVPAPQPGWRARDYFPAGAFGGVEFARRPRRTRVLLGPAEGRSGCWTELGRGRGGSVSGTAEVGSALLWVLVDRADPLHRRFVADRVLFDPRLVVWTGTADVPPGGGVLDVAWRRHRVREPRPAPPPARRLLHLVEASAPGTDPWLLGARVEPLDAGRPPLWVERRRPLRLALGAGRYALRLVGPEGVSGRRTISVPDDGRLVLPLAQDDSVELRVPLPADELAAGETGLRLLRGGVPVDVERAVSPDGVAEAPRSIVAQARRALVTLRPAGALRALRERRVLAVPPLRPSSRRLRLEPVGRGQLDVVVVDRRGRPRPGLPLAVAAPEDPLGMRPLAPFGAVEDPRSGLSWAELRTGPGGRVLLGGVPDGTWQLLVLDPRDPDPRHVAGSTAVRVLDGRIVKALVVVDLPR